MLIGIYTSPCVVSLQNSSMFHNDIIVRILELFVQKFFLSIPILVMGMGNQRRLFSGNQQGMFSFSMCLSVYNFRALRTSLYGSFCLHSVVLFLRFLFRCCFPSLLFLLFFSSSIQLCILVLLVFCFAV